MSAPIISIQSNCGYIDIIIGPMFSGKTSYLLRELSIFEGMGSSVLYINHSIDNRADQSFSTHNPLISKEIESKLNGMDMVKTDDLSSMYDKAKKYDIIGIDEAQFFKDLKKFVLNMAEVHGKRVILCGLSGNFKREIFGEVMELIPLCDRVTKLSSCCKRCARKKMIKEAHFSYLFFTGSEENDVVVGGSETYIPVCRECFLELSSLHK